MVRNAASFSALAWMISPLSSVRVSCNDGQNTPTDPLKKCGEPTTPRALPSSQSRRTKVCPASGTYETPRLEAIPRNTDSSATSLPCSKMASRITRVVAYSPASNRIPPNRLSESRWCRHPMLTTDDRLRPTPNVVKNRPFQRTAKRSSQQPVRDGRCWDAQLVVGDER